MPLEKNEILDLVQHQLTPEQLQASLIYWDQRLLRLGESLRMGPVQSIPIPFDGTLVFVDLAPRFNWAHPCLYLLVSAQDERVQVVEGSFPPFGRVIPESVISLLRYGQAPEHERDFRVYDE